MHQRIANSSSALAALAVSMLVGCAVTADPGPSPNQAATTKQALEVAASPETTAQLGIVAWRVEPAKDGVFGVYGVDAKGAVVGRMTTTVDQVNREVVVRSLAPFAGEMRASLDGTPKAATVSPEGIHFLERVKQDLREFELKGGEVPYGCDFWGGLAAVAGCVGAGAACTVVVASVGATGGASTPAAVIVCGAGFVGCGAAVAACS